MSKLTHESKFGLVQLIFFIRHLLKSEAHDKIHQDFLRVRKFIKVPYPNTIHHSYIKDVLARWPVIDTIIKVIITLQPYVVLEKYEIQVFFRLPL